MRPSDGDDGKAVAIRSRTGDTKMGPLNGAGMPFAEFQLSPPEVTYAVATSSFDPSPITYELCNAGAVVASREGGQLLPLC